MSYGRRTTLLMHLDYTNDNDVETIDEYRHNRKPYTVPAKIDRRIKDSFSYFIKARKKVVVASSAFVPPSR